MIFIRLTFTSQKIRINIENSRNIDLFFISEPATESLALGASEQKIFPSQSPFIFKQWLATLIHYF
jgi:hypothetical protein